MTIDEILKSRGNGIHFTSMLALTEPHANYPGKTPAPRVAIFRRLEKMNDQTRDVLDEAAASLRTSPSLESLPPDTLYMFRQRLLCALDFLSRLADSEPADAWLHTASRDMELEDRWLLVGICKEFGLQWLQNLAWRISRGMPEMQ